MANFVSYSNMEALMNAIGLKFQALAGAYILKGSVAFNELPSTLTADMVGFVYDVNEEFTTDARFKGYVAPGQKYPAGTNIAVAAVDVSGTTTYLFDVMAGFIDTDDIYAKIAAAVNLVAPAFSATKAGGYAIGDYVVYGGQIYQFTAAHTGAWDDDDATPIGNVTDLVEDFAATLEAEIAANTAAIASLANSVADEFDATEAYGAGDVVIYENQLYKFNAAHAAGAWIGTDADETTLESLIDDAEPESLDPLEVTTLIGLLDNPVVGP